jgi:hypothetical protein
MGSLQFNTEGLRWAQWTSILESGWTPVGSLKSNIGVWRESGGSFQFNTEVRRESGDLITVQY